MDSMPIAASRDNPLLQAAVQNSVYGSHTTTSCCQAAAPLLLLLLRDALLTVVLLLLPGIAAAAAPALAAAAHAHALAGERQALACHVHAQHARLDGLAHLDDVSSILDKAVLQANCATVADETVAGMLREMYSEATRQHPGQLSLLAQEHCCNVCLKHCWEPRCCASVVIC